MSSKDEFTVEKYPEGYSCPVAEKFGVASDEVVPANSDWHLEGLAAKVKHMVLGSIPGDIGDRMVAPIKNRAASYLGFPTDDDTKPEDPKDLSL